jgi:hypothetical protein
MLDYLSKPHGGATRIAFGTGTAALAILLSVRPPLLRLPLRVEPA